MPEYLKIQEFKADRRIEHDEDNIQIERLLDAAEAQLGDVNNGILRRPVVAREFTERFASFDAVEISHPDEVTALSVQYTDAAGAPATLADIYTVQNGRLVLDDGAKWPTRQGKVTVTYTAGWPVGSVPGPIRDAGYFIAGQMYDHRDDFDAERFRQVLAIMTAGYRRAGL